MATKRMCPECHEPLAPKAPDGLCPACLMKAGLGTGVNLGPDSDGTSGRTPLTAPTAKELASLFPQLEIQGLIGQGGMGAVYKARQRELDRIVALKILPSEISKDPAFAERFTREARALAKLNHPGIVTLYEFGKADGLFFFLMEFVDGVSLGHLLGAERISPREVLAIVPQICDALQYAHDQGIVHRDIKPENILLDRQGRVKVADFGLAKLMGTREKPLISPATVAGSLVLTAAGKVLGTPQYMAPEQSEAPATVDHRADIYSLGLVLYQMLTGELPGKPIQPPSQKVRIDVRLDEVVLRALEKDPQRRYQTAVDLRTQVEAIAASPAAQGVPVNRRALACTGLIFSCWSGAMGALVWTVLPDRTAVLVWTILAIAVAGFVLPIPDRKTLLGRTGQIVGGLNLAVWLILAAGSGFSKGSLAPATVPARSNGVEVVNHAARSFGPVRERVIPFGAPCAQKYFQFLTGNVIAIGDGPGDTSDHADDFRRAEETGGLDATVEGWEDGVHLVGRGCIFVRVKSQDWEAAKPEETVARLKREPWLQGVLEIPKKDFPATCLFKTARGDCGILQVFGLANDSRGWNQLGTRIRYKLAPTSRARDAVGEGAGF